MKAKAKEVSNPIPSETLKRFVGEVKPADDFGRKNSLKFIDQTHVGSTRKDGKLLPCFRVDVWITAWVSETSLFPSSRIHPSFYVCYDEDQDMILNLTKSSVNIEDIYQEAMSKKMRSIA